MLNLKTIFSYIIVIALASADCDTEAVKKCDTLEKELAAKKFPQTKDELKSVCDKLFEGGKCLADLAPKCLKPNMLKLAQDILSAEKKVLTDTCSTGADQYIKDSKDCFNKPEVISGLEDIHKRYVGIVEASQGFDKSTYQQSFCCSQLYSLDTVYELNSNKCSKETADRLKAIATNTVKTLFSFVLHHKH